MTIRNLRRKDHSLEYEDRAWADLKNRDWEGALPIAFGEDYFYVPGELLLTRAAVEFAKRQGIDIGRPDERTAEQGRNLDAVRYLVDGDEGTVPDLVRRLRAEIARTDASTSEVRVGPNHVLRGEPKYHGEPASPPSPANPREVAASVPRHDSVAIAVLDTGVWKGWPGQPSLADVLMPDADDEDILDVDGDAILETEAGHGTFISGLVSQVAPGLRIDPGKVLDPTGIGDEFSIALELAETKALVVNLSLGGYTLDDLPPVALQAAVEALWPDRVVVAAAGNNASDRPFWPAAFKHVISVGAVDSRNGAVSRAAFSNYGSWVDVWAPGVDLVSTYVDGRWATAGHVVRFEGWARWSGTSFAAPLVAATIAERALASNPRVAAHDFLGSLPVEPGLGPLFVPSNDLTG